MVTLSPVVIVTPWYPTDDHVTNGIFVRDHAELVAAFRGVAVIHLDGLRDTGDTVQLSPVERSEVTGGIPTVRARIRRTAPGLSLWRWGRAVAASLRALDVPRPILHAHVFTAGSAAVLARRDAVALVVTEHWSGVARGLSTRDRLRAELAYRGADTVTTPSSFLRERLPAIRRAVVVPNPLARSWFDEDQVPRRDADRPLVVAIGNLNREKRFDRLIDAFAIVAHERPDARLRIAGDGPLADDLRERASRTAGGRIEFVGRVNRIAVRELLLQADVVAVSSDVETFSVVTAEALAMGTPVVATACGGPAELIGPGAGLVTERSATALAQGIDQVLRGEAAVDPVRMRACVAHLHPDHVGRRWEEIYGQLGDKAATRWRLRSTGRSREAS